ncbi:MAG: hypothetical protein COA96_00595 [SAR86 cluster bacterium]|uniref:DUF4381 domain-containing protein n=1 Tax=SAR86 cluster bacterium TaxID=2030880 RepID=A0A2A5BAW9_9GAMM|nr:MAG: hypothetical protein COA96_00595 [SAR86 cluster bacterium]
MDSEELLAQLADIHLPEAISYWPPAPGWWVLAVLLLVATVLLARKYARYNRQQKICQYALSELEQCYVQYSHSDNSDTDQLQLRYLNAFNSVIRRVALVHYPQSNVASLAGTQWVDFIREKGDSSQMTEEIASALSYGRFQTKCNVDVDAMQLLGQRWINSLYQSNKGVKTNLEGQI